MLGILIGIFIAIGFISFFNLLKTKKITLKWWQWIITVLWFLYTAFVLKMIESFVQEGALKAALVMGLIFGFIAIVWAILIFRFILKPQMQTS